MLAEIRKAVDKHIPEEPPEPKPQWCVERDRNGDWALWIRSPFYELGDGAQTAWVDSAGLHIETDDGSPGSGGRVSLPTDAVEELLRRAKEK
jgi:hypothetical protein